MQLSEGFLLQGLISHALALFVPPLPTWVMCLFLRGKIIAQTSFKDKFEGCAACMFSLSWFNSFQTLNLLWYCFWELDLWFIILAFWQSFFCFVSSQDWGDRPPMFIIVLKQVFISISLCRILLFKYSIFPVIGL